MLEGKSGCVKRNSNKEKAEESGGRDGRGKAGRRGSSRVTLTFAGQGTRGDFCGLRLALLQEAER